MSSRRFCSDQALGIDVDPSEILPNQGCTFSVRDATKKYCNLITDHDSDADVRTFVSSLPGSISTSASGAIVEKSNANDVPNLPAPSQLLQLVALNRNTSQGRLGVEASTERPRASPGEAVSAYAGPWLCGLGHSDGQDGQDSQLHQQSRQAQKQQQTEQLLHLQEHMSQEESLIGKQALTANQSVSLQCEVTLDVPAPINYGNLTIMQMMDDVHNHQMYSPESMELLPTAKLPETIRAPCAPTENAEQPADVAAFWRKNTDDGNSLDGPVQYMVTSGRRKTIVVTEHTEQSDRTCGLWSDRYHADNSVITASPQLQRLLIREHLRSGTRKKSAHSHPALDEGSSTDHEGSPTDQVSGLPVLRRTRSCDVRETFENHAAMIDHSPLLSPVHSPRTPFMKLGLQSNDISNIANALSEALDFTISAVDLYNYPTMNSLLEHVRNRGIEDLLEGMSQPSLSPLSLLKTSPSSPASVTSIPINEVAIVATSCALPGAIHSPQGLAAALASASDKISRVPHTRWDADSWLARNEAAQIYTDQSGFLDQAQCFDHGYFGIRVGEVKRMDPQQRLVLEHTTNALGQAFSGCPISEIVGRQVAVYVGSSHHDWEQLLARGNEASPYNTTGAASSILAGRVSFELGLRGPSMVVDTACSSSLVACGLGHTSVQTSVSSEAVVSGINMLLDPKQSLYYCQTRMLAIDGRCKTFDSKANGYVRSDGCIALVLQKVVHFKSKSVLSAIATNQDGKSSVLTAPNGLSQQAVISMAQATADNIQVRCYEAHGTGTSLGDPIEVCALAAVVSGVYGIPLQIGAVKSQLGHTEGVAGITGLVKMVSVLETQVLDSNLHFKVVNSNIIEHLGLLLPTTGSADRYRDLGVSSFGMSGTNAHAVLQSKIKNISCGTWSMKMKPVMEYQHTAFVWWETSSTTTTKAVPLLGVSTTALGTGADMVWERSWPAATSSYLAHHCVGRTSLTPGTGYLCMVREAIELSTNRNDTDVHVSDAQFKAILFLDSAAPQVRLSVKSESEYSSTVTIEASLAMGEWVQHAVVVLDTGQQLNQAASVTPIVDGCPMSQSAKELYSQKSENIYLCDFGSVQTTQLLGKSEQQRLRLGSWMGGSSQSGVLSSLEPNDQLYAFDEFNEGGSAQQQPMPQWLEQVVGNDGSRLTYLKSGQLEVLRTRQNLYDTVWEALPALDASSDKEEQGGVAMVWEGSDDGNLLLQGAFGAFSNVVVQLEEVCAGLGRVEVLFCLPVHAVVPDSVLRAMQVAASSGASVWLVSQSGAAAAHRGLAKSVHAETEQHVKCVEIAKSQHAAISLAQLTFLSSHQDTELNIAEDGQAAVCQLRQMVVHGQRIEQLSSSTQHGCLVSGGTGGLGLLSACWLMRHGAASLVLLSRSGGTPRGTEQHWADVTTAQSLSVCVELCDMGSKWQLSRSAECGCNGLESIVHSAGVLVDALLLHQTQSGLQKVWAPKAHAAWGLHQASSNQNTAVNGFVLFSSIVALLGNAGQANYAAANGQLDGLVQLRRGLGLAGSSVQWGAWAGVGMAADSGVLKQLEKQGFGAIREEQGLCALELAMSGSDGSAVMGMMPFMWPVLFGMMSGDVPAFFTGFAHLALADEESCCQNTAAETTLVARLNMQLTGTCGWWQEDAEAQAVALESMVLHSVHVASGVSVEPDDPLMESGVDSLAATELRTSLQHELGSSVKLPSTIMFDYPTSAEIAQFIQSAMESNVAVAPHTPLDDSTAACMPPSIPSIDKQFTIAATTCYAPGGKSTCNALWVMLACGQEPLELIPQHRFDVDALDGTVMALRAKQAHFFAHAELFDHSYFRISPAEAAAMDPHQRLLLETSYSVLASCNETRASLMGSAVGVFVGVMTDGEWGTCQQRVMQQSEKPISVFAANASGGAGLSGRVSFVLGLKGPCLSVNTYCSSSLVALDAAAQNLQLGRCSRGLVVGVNMISDPMGFLVYGAVLAPDGRCKTFDAAANGVGRGDACGALVLEPGSAIMTQSTDYLKDDLSVQMVGSAVNQDGRSASMSAPNGPSQIEVLRSAMHQTALDSLFRCFIETHGTGTSLGDPIEVGALQVVLGKSDGSECLVLGALKSQLGHTEGAAGVLGVLKALHVLDQRSIPPNLHLQKVNGHLELDGYAVAMSSDAVPLVVQMHNQNTAEATGVSSFGMSGTNAHIALAQNKGMRAVANCQQRRVQYQHTAFVWWETSSTGDDMVRELQTVSERPNNLHQSGVPATSLYLQALVLDQISNVTDQLEVSLEEPLLEGGLDSLAATELANQLSLHLGDIPMPATLLFDYPTVSRLVSHLELALSQPSCNTDAPVPVQIAPSTGTTHLCITGQGCVLPGELQSPTKLWLFLNACVDPICDVPAGRWDPAECQGAYVQQGGYVLSLHNFDNAFFRVSPSEARAMEPQQRLFLEVGFAALCQVYSTPQDLNESAVGVFAGAMGGEFRGLACRSTKLPGPFTATGAHSALVANRFSYAFGLEGPSLTVDTACSASLVALDIASQSLKNMACGTALVAGVNTMLGPGGFIETCAAHMLSPTAHCKTFDASADGYARAEGCSAIVLGTVVGPTESKSESALVSGSAVNQDGRSANLTSPNGPAQQRVITQALLRACFEASQVMSVEAHGTGTPLGDPIEVGAQQAVLSRARMSRDPLVNCSSKSLFGHMELGAGLLSILKATAALETSLATPNHHFKLLNPNLSTSAIAVFVSGCTLLRQKNIIGVSSFGYGGTNSHITLCTSEQSLQLLRVRSLVQYQHTPFIWWDPEAVSVATEAVPLLGVSSMTAGSEMMWEHTWPSDICNYMAQHRVGRTPLAPGPGFLQLARIAYHQLNSIWSMEMFDIKFLAPMFLVDCKDVLVRVSQSTVTEETFEVMSNTNNKWVTHTLASTIALDPAGSEATAFHIEPATVPFDGEALYAASGNDLRGDFRCLQQTWLVDEDLANAGVLSRLHFDTNPPGHDLVESAHLRAIAWMAASGQADAPTTHIGQPVIIVGFESYKFGESAGSMDSSIWGLVRQTTTKTYDATQWLCSCTSMGGFHYFRSGVMPNEPTDSTQFTWEESWVPHTNTSGGSIGAGLDRHLFLGIGFDDTLDLCSYNQVIYTGALETNEACHDVQSDVLKLVKAVAQGSTHLVILTHNTHAPNTFPDNTCESWQHAGIWGFARAVRTDFPRMRLQCLELMGNLQLSDELVSAALNGVLQNDLKPEDSELLIISPESVLKHCLVRGACSLGETAAGATAPSSTLLCPAVSNCAAVCLGIAASNHTLDTGDSDKCTAAQELLARQYLSVAIEAVPLHQVHHEHHRMLWRRWHTRLLLTETQPETSYHAIVQVWPEVASSLAMLERCGPALADVLTGAVDPLVLLFPAGSMDEAEAVYADTPTNMLYNNCVGSAIKTLVHTLQEQPQLRFIEIGGGTGGTTTSILPILPSTCTEYWFTDLGKAFLLRAQKRWGMQYPFVRYGIFDAEKDPAEQGFAAHSFDVVVAVNVLHATSDLHQTLTNTHRLMKPGAFLILSEITEVEETAVLDATWGLTDGWWLMSDGRDFPLQSRNQWQQWFDKSGLEFQAAEPQLRDQCGQGQTIFMASARVPEKLGRLVSCSQGITTQLPHLVCGGLDGIGLETCRWLAESGATNIWITSLSGSGSVKDAKAQNKLDMIMKYPVGALAFACDTTEISDVRALLKGQSFAGIVQSTLVIDGGHPDQLCTAWALKIESIKHLHSQAQHSPQSWILTYSSVASLLGQAASSVATACSSALDSFAVRRQGLGQATLNVQWGVWQGVGKAQRDSETLLQQSSVDKMGGLSTRVCMRALTTVCTLGRSFVVTSYLSFEPILEANSLLFGLQNELPPADPNLPKHEDSPHQFDVNNIDAAVMDIIYCSTGIKMELHDHLTDAGIDSLMGIELLSELQKLVGTERLQLSGNFLFDYPTAFAISECFKAVAVEMPVATENSEPDPAAREAATRAYAKRFGWRLLQTPFVPLEPDPDSVPLINAEAQLDDVLHPAVPPMTTLLNMPEGAEDTQLPPLFLAAPKSGWSAAYNDLAKAIGGRTIYGLDLDEAMSMSLDELVDELGGWVAVAIANGLQSIGS